MFDYYDEKWYISLRLEQRVLIKRLLDELDSADNYFKKVYLENKQLKAQIEEYQKKNTIN